MNSSGMCAPAFRNDVILQIHENVMRIAFKCIQKTESVSSFAIIIIIPIPKPINTKSIYSFAAKQSSSG